MTTSQLGNSNTASESLFELYLTENGYTEWTHEQPTPSKPTTPDYRVRFGAGDLYFEVKEFESDDLVQAAARRAYNPGNSGFRVAVRSCGVNREEANFGRSAEGIGLRQQGI
jgi:hypothetical protein